MYCPNCAHENQPDIKFCTRCGTNVGVVSEALTKVVGSSKVIDERLAKVIKDYYHGRRDTITGLVLLPAAVKAISLLIMLGLPPVASFFVISWMVFWGIAALAGGLGKWVAASGEMKALGYTPPSSKLWMRTQKLLSRGDPARATNDLAERVEIPSSVTEHTTRELEARGRVTPTTHQ
ncbi:MAG TPA: zinc ribbon domain-containing protein [Blastocatellia bacterium]|nr:zinc ribbon domain-containing protein [Blastocatellia bacterium]